MKHLQFSPTPVSELNYFSRKFGINLICKRDDLFQDAGGGSKARMLQYILPNVNSSNCDVLVTAGGPCSNFNRACSLMCARLGIPMHLIEYTDEPAEWESLNYYLCKLAGIRTTRCNKDSVPATIQQVLNEYKGQNVKAKFVYGGGRSVEGIYAYYDAVCELKQQVNNVDYVFVACGTGTTLTGISAGLQTNFPNAKVFAISTARTESQEMGVLHENIEMINHYLQTKFNLNNIVFTDEYLCGGYAKYNDKLFESVKECISKEGMLIDPTYSGKAFYGMCDIIEHSLKKFRGKTVLFWNTGGIYNLLSSIL